MALHHPEEDRYASPPPRRRPLPTQSTHAQEPSIRPISSPPPFESRQGHYQNMYEEQQEEYDPYREAPDEGDFNQQSRNGNSRRDGAGLDRGFDQDMNLQRGGGGGYRVEENWEEGERLDENQEFEEGEGGHVFDGSYSYPEDDDHQLNLVDNVSNRYNREEDRYSSAPSAYRPRSGAFDEDEEKAGMEENSFDADDWNEKERALDDQNEEEYVPPTPASFNGGFGAPPEVRALSDLLQLFMH